MQEEGARAAPQSIGCERCRDGLVRPPLICRQLRRLAVREDAPGQRVAHHGQIFDTGETFCLEIAKKRGGQAEVASARERQCALVGERFKNERSPERARSAVFTQVLNAGEHLALRRVEPKLVDDLRRDLRSSQAVRPLEEAALDERGDRGRSAL